jgi:hypothetical protein
MSKKNLDVDLDRALLDPTAVFTTPEEVRDHPGLDREQKVLILRRWKYDASELQVAEEEGMGGGEDPPLARISRVLESFAEGDELEPAPPVKQ